MRGKWGGKRGERREKAGKQGGQKEKNQQLEDRRKGRVHTYVAPDSYEPRARKHTIGSKSGPIPDIKTIF